MSTNIHFSATREIMVVKTGKHDVQTIQYDVRQTPTDVTWAIKESADPVQAYREWVLANSREEAYEIYAYDDVFQERDPVGYETYNPGEIHIADFDAWVKMCDENGYTIQVDAW